MIIKIQYIVFKYALLLGLSLFLTNVAQAQCEGDIILSSQADVDSFATEACTEINGSLIIGEEEYPYGEEPILINNITSLSLIELIEGDLKINNTILPSLTGLEGVITINGSLEIRENDNLINTNGLSSLISIEENLDIRENALLNNITFPILETIGGYAYIYNNDGLLSLSLGIINSIGEYLWIRDNDTLLNLNNLTQGNLELLNVSIEANDQLNNIDGLLAIDSISEDLAIFANDTLSICCPIECIVASVQGEIYLDINEIGCNSLEEIAANCCNCALNPTPPTINGTLSFCSDQSTIISAENGFTNYEWTNASGIVIASVQSVTINASGDYTITGEDAVGCTSSTTVTVIESESSEPPTIDGALSFCADQSTTLSAENGFTNYVWTNADGDEIANLQSVVINTSGEYTLSALDSNGCLVEASFIITIEEIDPPTILENLTICNGGSTELSIDEYDSYSWNFDGQEIGTDQSITVSDIGDYTLDVMLNNCSASTSFTIDAYPAIVINTIELNNAGDCGDLNSGNIQVSAMGGTSPYTYELNEDSNQDGYFDNLSPSDYTLIVTDASSCQESISFSIGIEDVTISVADTSLINETCLGGDGGVALSSAYGGTYPYEYTLGDSTKSEPIFLEQLSAGDYTIVIEDAIGCFALIDFTIEADPPFEAVFYSDDSSCGENNGSLSAIVQSDGSNNPYQYNINGVIYNAPPDLDDLPPDDYDITITNGLECQIDTMVTIADSEPLTVTPIITNTICGVDNGFVEFNVVTGVADYEYAIAQVNGGIAQNDSIFDNLANGFYNVTITDAVGCEWLDTFFIEGPLVLSGTIEDITNTSCGLSNGIIEVSGAGGTPPYTYTLIGGETATDGIFDSLDVGFYDVIISDSADPACDTIITDIEISNFTPLISEIETTGSNICGATGDGTVNISVENGLEPYSYFYINEIGDTIENDSGSFIDSLASGDYTIIVKDANDCEDQELISIASNTNINLLVAENNLICEGYSGTVVLSGSGGSGNYEYALLGEPFSADSIFENLSPAEYVFVIQDDINCQDSILVVVEESVLLMSVEESPINCAGGSDGHIIINTYGGQMPLNYTLIDSITSISQDTNVFEGLSAGTYEVIIEDAIGCIQSDSVYIASPDSILSQIYYLDAPCSLDDEGAIEIAAIGGVRDYFYSLDGIHYSPDSIFVEVDSSTESIYILDNLGCVVDFPLEYPVLPIVELKYIYDDINNNLYADVDNFSGAYEVEWGGPSGPGGDILTIQNPLPGYYTVTVYLELNDGTICDYTANYEVPSIIPIKSIDLQEFQIYPNPVESELVIEWEGIVSPEKVVLHSINGQIQQSKLWEEGLNKVAIDVRDLPNGLYLVQFYTKEGFFTKKLIVQH